jgi:hypothetical protein
VRCDRREPRAARDDEIAGLHETSPLREANIIIQLQIEDERWGKCRRGRAGLCQSSNPPNDHGTWVLERTGAKKSRQSVLKAAASPGRLGRYRG